MTKKNRESRLLEDHLELEAVKQFLSEVTLPILVEHEGERVIQGTGTLFRVKNELLMVTAGHVFMDPDTGKTIDVYVPIDRDGLQLVKLRGKFFVTIESVHD